MNKAPKVNIGRPPKAVQEQVNRRLEHGERARTLVAWRIPVILLASDVSDTSQVRALEAGVDDVLGLPIRLPLLKARVDNLLENRRKLHAHFQQLQTVQSRELAMNQVDSVFLRRVVGIVDNDLADYEFDMETLEQQMGVSRRQLFRKFKALAGCAPQRLHPRHPAQAGRPVAARLANDRF